MELVPIRAEETFEEISLLVGRRYQLHAVDVLDASGNRILYRFSDLQRNGEIPEAIFQFQPPAGTEFLGEDPGQ